MRLGTVPDCTHGSDKGGNMRNIEIRQLDYSKFEGQKYEAKITTDRYLAIEPRDDGYLVQWKELPEPMTHTLSDEMLSDWLDDPVAYGAFDGDELLGFVEGFLEKWNNRYRIANICVFDSEARRSGIGTKLIEIMISEAAKSKARMVVLETQSYNFKAISFYKKNGFEIIGFDRYAYSNHDPEDHNLRIEMGRMI